MAEKKVAKLREQILTKTSEIKKPEEKKVVDIGIKPEKVPPREA